MTSMRSTLRSLARRVTASARDTAPAPTCTAWWPRQEVSQSYAGTVWAYAICWSHDLPKSSSSGLCLQVAHTCADRTQLENAQPHAAISPSGRAHQRSSKHASQLLQATASTFLARAFVLESDFKHPCPKVPAIGTVHGLVATLNSKHRERGTTRASITGQRQPARLLWASLLQRRRRAFRKLSGNAAVGKTLATIS